MEAAGVEPIDRGDNQIQHDSKMFRLSGLKSLWFWYHSNQHGSKTVSF